MPTHDSDAKRVFAQLDREQGQSIPMPPVKRITFIFDDDATGPYFSGSLWQTLETLHNSLSELEDGSEQVFRIKRHDLTTEEIERLPVT